MSKVYDIPIYWLLLSLCIILYSHQEVSGARVWQAGLFSPARPLHSPHLTADSGWRGTEVVPPP